TSARFTRLDPQNRSHAPPCGPGNGMSRTVGCQRRAVCRTRLAESNGGNAPNLPGVLLLGQDRPLAPGPPLASQEARCTKACCCTPAVGTVIPAAGPGPVVSGSWGSRS